MKFSMKLDMHVHLTCGGKRNCMDMFVIINTQKYTDVLKIEDQYFLQKARQIIFLFQFPKSQINTFVQIVSLVKHRPTLRDAHITRHIFSPLRDIGVL